MGDSDGNKKVVVAGLASILLVAAVVGVAVSSTRSHGGNADSTNTSTKAVQAICSSTNYKETCEKSLAHANSSNPKDLIKTAIDATLQNIGDVLKNSALLKEAAADGRTKDALSVCQEVLEASVDDLKRSFDRVGEFDASKADEYVADLRTWLSAVVTDQETCIDAFENTTGDTGEKMKALIRTARELSSNGLAMVTHMSSLVASLDLANTASSRSMLAEESEHFVNRRLLDAAGKEPNAVVAQDGSGQFKTINEAIAAVPRKSNSTYVILVKAGLYKEYVDIPKGANNVILVGEGQLKTIITGDKNYVAGVQTYYSATVAVGGMNFMAKDIAFENTAGPGGEQAVALRISGDNAVLYNIAVNGYQDSLYAHKHRQYYRDCTITGTIDFVFGDAVAIFQNCKFVVRLPAVNQGCMVTAQGRIDLNSIGATVIQNCTFTAEPQFLSAQPMPKAYLGRPWKEYSRTIIMQSDIEGFIDPAGWSVWGGTWGLDTCYYAEYDNRGAGSNTTKRVTWKGIQNITLETAESWTGGKIYGDDSWVTKSGVPYVPTMVQI